MAGTFDEQTRRLEQMVGDGELIGELVVDQPYAKYQHETPGLQHPRGGGWKYLERPLQEHYPQYLDRLADNVLDGDLVSAMANNMEHLNDQLAGSAPIDEPEDEREEPAMLRRSGSPRVYDGGEQVYYRPPESPRERG